MKSRLISTTLYVDSDLKAKLPALSPWFIAQTTKLGSKISRKVLYFKMLYVGSIFVVFIFTHLIDLYISSDGEVHYRIM